MRALRLADAAEGIEAVFDDIAALAEGCRFGDCGHEDEPGCAVQAAIAAGGLDPGRLARWRKLAREDARNTATLAEARARERAQGPLLTARSSGRSGGARADALRGHRFVSAAGIRRDRPGRCSTSYQRPSVLTSRRSRPRSEPTSRGTVPPAGSDRRQSRPRFRVRRGGHARLGDRRSRPHPLALRHSPPGDGPAEAVLRLVGRAEARFDRKHRTTVAPNGQPDRRLVSYLVSPAAIRLNRRW